MSRAFKLVSSDISSIGSAVSDSRSATFLYSTMPVLKELLSELKLSFSELVDVITPVQKIAAQLTIGDVSDEIVDYLESKQQMLLSYCVLVVYYLKLKTCIGIDDKGAKHDAVLKKLLETRYIVEKLKGLDSKLKYQIDRLLGYNALDIGEKKASSLRPNIGNMLDDSSDEGDEDVRSGTKDKKTSDRKYDKTNRYDDNYDDDENDKYDNKVYKAPKLMAMPYREFEKQSERDSSTMKKKKKKMKNSEIIDALRDEFSTRPEASSSTGISNFSSQHKKLREEQLERQNFEEDHFIRTQLTKKQKQSIKKRTYESNRIDNFSDIGNVADFDDIIKLTRGGGEGSNSTGKSRTKALNESTAMKKSFKTFSKAGEGMESERKRHKHI